MPRSKPIAACDCETDPFLTGRRPEPFIWGYYDGRSYLTFTDTKSFVEHVRDLSIVLFAHNGGKFDFIYLLPFVGETKVQIINGRIISMFLGACELRDSFAIIPVALKELGGKKDIEIWKLEKAHRVKHATEIGTYLYHDCKSLYDAVNAYRQAAGKYKTIASNALAFSKRIGIDPGKTNFRFDANFRKFYFGGRTECLKPGSHKNLAVLDIHSAYPYAMSQDHASGHEFFGRSNLEGMSREEIQRSFITLNCSARGCFPIRAGAQGLIFPHEFNEFNVTGWEYIAALDLGLIENEEIIEVRTFAGKINFAPYVKHWYEYKEAHPKKTDPMNYTIGKIMMNSLYGKLAQNPARYYDYKIVKGGTPFCHCPVNKETGALEYNPQCPIKKADDHGWTHAHEWDNHEIHERPSMWKYRFNYGADWVSKNIYKNVATGASVTGFTRAHLLRAMHAVGIETVIYCDTDSLTVLPGANISALPQTPKLGDWELEEANAPIGHFAGKKLYAIAQSKTGKFKIASKGARLNQKDIVQMIDGHKTQWREKDDQTAFDKIQAITEGKTIVWTNDAPTFSLAGKANFVVRNIRSTARTGPNISKGKDHGSKRKVRA